MAQRDRRGTQKVQFINSDEIHSCPPLLTNINQLRKSSHRMTWLCLVGTLKFLGRHRRFLPEILSLLLCDSESVTERWKNVQFAFGGLGSIWAQWPVHSRCCFNKSAANGWWLHVARIAYNLRIIRDNMVRSVASWPRRQRRTGAIKFLQDVLCGGYFRRTWNNYVFVICANYYWKDMEIISFYTELII